MPAICASIRVPPRQQGQSDLEAYHFFISPSFLFLQTHYLFGGNPGLGRSPKMRLADFWALQLVRIDEAEILRRCRLALRQQAFRELAVHYPREALQYLRSEVADLVDRTKPAEVAEYQKLAACVFGKADQERRWKLSTSHASFLFFFFFCRCRSQQQPRRCARRPQWSIPGSLQLFPQVHARA